MDRLGRFRMVTSTLLAEWPTGNRPDPEVFAVVLYLSARGPARPSDIAADLGIGRRRIARLCARGLAQGWLTQKSQRGPYSLTPKAVKMRQRARGA